MSSAAAPIIYALLLWWFSTGIILYLDGLPQRTYRWSLSGAGLLAIGALIGLFLSAGIATPLGAYVAFTCALLAWGWIEMSFLMGVVTGPRRTACPPGASGWRRFRCAWQAIAHHELLLAATLLLIAGLCLHGDNLVGVWTFLALWLMRLSTKFNVFLGVRNLAENWLPEGLRYLGSYFGRRPMNALFPFSITATTVATILVFKAAFAPGVGAFEATGLLLIGSLLALGVIEHWFLVLPVTLDRLFRWGFRSRDRHTEGSRREATRPLQP